MSGVGKGKKRSTAGRGFVKWLVRIIVVALVFPLVLLAIGFVYETVASGSDWDRYPPPGELIDIGGYRLHLHCTGERGAGQPAVIIEAGAGSSSPDWVLVQPEIAKFARVCSYDRAGLGWSDPGPEPRGAQQYASELRALLERSGEGPPYLLVAHSYGAHVARIYTDEHSEDVVGMVLVDARLASGEIPYKSMSAGQLSLWEFLARCGFFRMAGKQAMQLMAPAIAEKIPDYPYPIVWAPRYFKESRLEGMTVTESDRRARETGPFGDLPLAVIMAGRSSSFSHLPPDEMEEAEATAEAEHRELANLSTKGRFLVAEGSGHNIPVENPEIVITAVREMVAESQ